MQTIAAVLTQTQAARFLNRSLRTLALWREKGYGPPFLRIGSAVMYQIEDLRSFLESNRVVPQAGELRGEEHTRARHHRRSF
jgi:Helix-turn-helix domain